MRGPSLLGDLDEGAAAVLGAAGAAYQPATLHPGDVVGEPAALPEHLAGQVADPHPPLRAVGEVHQHLEVGVGQAGVVLHLTVQGRVQRSRSAAATVARGAARRRSASGASELMATSYPGIVDTSPKLRL